MQRSAAAQCSVCMQHSKLQKSGTMCVRRQERAGKETTRGQSHEILRYADLKPGAAIQCSVVQCSAEKYGVGQCSAVQCSAAQCSAVQCRVV